MRLLFIILALAPFYAQADCYIVGDLKGYAARMGGDYTMVPNGFGKQLFVIDIDGDESSVKPNGMPCKQMGATNLVCANDSAVGRTSLETWSLYPDEGKVVFTKARNGLGPLNGGYLMVGDIKSTCD